MPIHCIFRVLSKMYMGNRQESGVRITGHNIKNPGDHSPGLPYLLHCRNIDQCQFFNICIFKTGDQRLSGIDRCQYIDTCLNSVSSDDNPSLECSAPCAGISMTRSISCPKMRSRSLATPARSCGPELLSRLLRSALLPCSL